MQIAIVGAGLAGLATAYAFCTHSSFASSSISIFEQKKVGGGASGVCSGLLHPYPGLHAHRSPRASEGIAATKALLQWASSFTNQSLYSDSPILRFAKTEEQKKQFERHCFLYQDVKSISSSLFSIESGLTVDMQAYLEALSIGLQSRGIEILSRQIKEIKDLFHFDLIVIAAGWGIATLCPSFTPSLQFLKGHAVRISGPSPWEASYISTGYIAAYHPAFFELGSTYERKFVDDTVDVEIAKTILEEKVEGRCKEREVIECRAGVRVALRSTVLPKIEKIGSYDPYPVWVFTGLGSRGLLYHALYANELVSQIYQDRVE